MGLSLPALTQGNPPPVGDGLARVRLEQIVVKEHEDWAGTDSYGNADDGRRIHFETTLVDDDGNDVFDPADDSGDPIMLDRLTRTATGKKSGYREQITAIMSKAEFAQYEAATPDAPWPGVAVIFGRIYDVMISHSKSGWPQIAQFIGVSKNQKGAKKVEA